MTDTPFVFISALSLDRDGRMTQPRRERSAAVHAGTWVLISMLAIIATRMLMAQ